MLIWATPPFASPRWAQELPGLHPSLPWATRWRERTALGVLSTAAGARGAGPRAGSSGLGQGRGRALPVAWHCSGHKGASAAFSVHALTKCRIAFGIVRITSVFTGASGELYLSALQGTGCYLLCSPSYRGVPAEGPFSICPSAGSCKVCRSSVISFSRYF